MFRYHRFGLDPEVREGRGGKKDGGREESRGRARLGGGGILVRLHKT